MADIIAELYASGITPSSLMGGPLISFSFEESMSGCASYAIKIKSDSASKYDGFIRDDQTPFGFLFGTSVPTGDLPSRSNQKKLLLLQARKKLVSNTSATYLFRGCCGGILLSRHRAKDKSWDNELISKMVRDLIEDVGLQADVATTEGKFKLMGCNQPTAEFISKTLLPLAFSQTGRDWRFWVKDGKEVVFRPTKPVGTTVKFSNTLKNGYVHLLGPEVIKDTRFQEEQRSGKIEVVMYDESSGRLIQKEFGESKGQFNYLGGRGRPIERQSVSETIIASMQKGRHTDVSPDKVVTRIGQTLWGRYGRSLYRIQSEIPYSPGLAINSPANVSLTGPLGESDANSGQWVVFGARHSVTSGVARSWVTLEKRWEA
mgnify:CR=1 FL=1